MVRMVGLSVLAVALGATLWAQGFGRGPEGGRPSDDRGPMHRHPPGGDEHFAGPRHPGPPPGNPLIAFFDRDHDGMLSESEIDAAADALRAKDRNGDGNVTERELGPPPGHGPVAGPEHHPRGPGFHGDDRDRGPPRGDMRDHPREGPPREGPPREGPPREGPPREGPPRDREGPRDGERGRPEGERGRPEGERAANDQPAEAQNSETAA